MAVSASMDPFPFHAFNIYLVAYRHQLPGDIPPMLITIDSFSQTTTMRPMPATAVPLTIPDRSATFDKNLKQGLMIGYTFPAAEDYAKQEAVDDGVSSAHKEFSIAKLTPATATILPYNPNALIVVAHMRNNSVIYYKLDIQNSSVIGYQVGIDKVFFLPEYRNATIAQFEHRKKVWPQHIREAFDLLRPGEAPVHKRQRVEAALKKNVVSHLCSLLLNYIESGDEPSLEQIKARLMRLGQNLVEHKRMLDKLCDRNGLNKEGTEASLIELMMAGPELAELETSADDLITTSRAVVTASSILGYHAMKASIKNVCKACCNLNDAQELPDQDNWSGLAGLMRDSSGSGPFMVPKMHASPLTGSVAGVLETGASHVSTLVNALEKSTTGLKGTFGHVTLPRSLESVRAAYTTEPTIDGVALASASLTRYNVDSIVKTNARVVEVMKATVLQWEDAAVELRGAVALDQAEAMGDA